MTLKWPGNKASLFRQLLLAILRGLLGAAVVSCSAAEDALVVEVDFAAFSGIVRPLHGINKGPLAANGIFDVTEAQKALRLPFTRLHDCHHPNPDVVDIHAVFPNPQADPADPASYDFRATDAYLAAVQTTGSQIIYRLGESIEHQPIKRWVHPPKSPTHWAEVSAGIVRHCNHGWAAGTQLGIRYWEIWNEPENRPVMWTGDDAQFLELYRVTARRLRREFPELRIGGPGFGYCGEFDGRSIKPSEFCQQFLRMCREDHLPLDFFSWHCYTAKPEELSARALAVRKMLDSAGFSQTESHLNEWNYLPGNSWDLLSRTAPADARQRGVEEMAGPAGAAFLVASLIRLQDAPVDVANFYHGETGIFGLFTEVGAPVRAYDGLRAFSEMLDSPRRCRVSGTDPGSLEVLVGIAKSGGEATLLVANLAGPDALSLKLQHLPWESPRMELRLVDSSHSLAPVSCPPLQAGSLSLTLPQPSVAVLKIIRP